MTKLEAIIYAIGKLDEMPREGVVSCVNLHDCSQNFVDGYQICRINILGTNALYLSKKVANDNVGNIMIQIHRDDYDIHQLAVIIDTAYSMHSKRHKDE